MLKDFFSVVIVALIQVVATDQCSKNGCKTFLSCHSWAFAIFLKIIVERVLSVVLADSIFSMHSN